MQVLKAVITAAAPNQNTLPLQRLVDRHGEEKTALQLIVEETLSAGIEEIGVVIQPGDEENYRRAAGSAIGSLRFLHQERPLGYADALLKAEEFCGDDAFLHLVGDHLYLSAAVNSCASQLVSVARQHGCPVSAVQATREHRLPYFGIVAGASVPRHEGLYEVRTVVEKPTPTLAEQELITPGLRSGHYLGYFGMHVLTPAVWSCLHELMEDASFESPTLSDAAAMLPSRGKYLAFQVQGKRFNIGVQYGVLIAQLAIGLSGRDRDLLLTEMVELLATRPDPMIEDDAALTASSSGNPSAKLSADGGVR
ncbi:UTP--glucose-1-phosphate uridylyltransferase [Neorhodopirellula lusitana]|uniref:UTP--glucose-1-phosphate uridylyltransferase n=1 Tax=Neorhodopirellula lusitana TaxID=445327 RepID=A0ABY1PU32_9BACT|nr:sugar phosphate nucleotidyltransferase [Neorhodopirellula lusitana]SMP47965.1 UTP--glucose-1-phosphate uridylyltransferase [Neorhodopirellula lusitana]